MSAKDIFLDGLTISGYRSFNNPVVFSDCQKINFLIGQNNSGKSNLLRFLSRHFCNLGHKYNRAKFVNLNDAPRTENANKFQFSVFVKFNGCIASNFAKKLDARDFRYFHGLLQMRPDGFWASFSLSGDSFTQDQTHLVNEVRKLSISHEHWWQLAQSLANMGGGNQEQLGVAVLEKMSQPVFFATKVDLIPALRSI